MTNSIRMIAAGAVFTTMALGAGCVEEDAHDISEFVDDADEQERRCYSDGEYMTHIGQCQVGCEDACGETDTYNSDAAACTNSCVTLCDSGVTVCPVNEQ